MRQNQLDMVMSGIHNGYLKVVWDALLHPHFYIIYYASLAVTVYSSLIIRIIITDRLLDDQHYLYFRFSVNIRDSISISVSSSF